MTSVSKDVTLLLGELRSGNEHAVAKLVPLLYGELRRMAASYLGRERRCHTLQPTALVHEAYLRLVDQKAVHWQNRQHFFGVAAQVMRRVLVDYARTERALELSSESEDCWCRVAPSRYASFSCSLTRLAHSACSSVLPR